MIAAGKPRQVAFVGVQAQAADDPQRDAARPCDVERRQASAARTVGLTLKIVANPFEAKPDSRLRFMAWFSPVRAAVRRCHLNSKVMSLRNHRGHLVRR